MASQCSVCLERYTRDFNPPISCIPCGHIVCQPCLQQWLRQNNSCPECRQRVNSQVINRPLLDLIESNGNNLNTSMNINHTKQSLFTFISDTSKNTKAEVIKDKSQITIYVLDNSPSMLAEDGKTFIENKDKTISKIDYVSRWDELVNKTIKIAEYNISRKIKAFYYLLNPIKTKKWEPKIDYIIIDPGLKNHTESLEILKMSILQSYNIRGNTPLDTITQHFIECLHSFINSDKSVNIPICYNIITDGEPNSSLAFEKKLRILVNKYNIFLTINLCTESDEVVEYYNDLDTKIGKELNGIDVIDDLESEQKEIINAGNTFFVYSHQIHICRMAGCNSVVADLIDEQKLPLHYINKFCKELMENDNKMPHCSQQKEFIEYIQNKNREVYDFYYKRFSPLINISQLKWTIWFQMEAQKYQKLWKKNFSNSILNQILLGLMIMFIVYIFMLLIF